MNAPIHVLLIEDNPGDARLVKEELSSPGSRIMVHLEWVDRLERGLEWLASNQVEAILLDLSLPDSEGLDTLHRVLANVPSLPVIVMTGQVDEETAIRAVQAGAQDYLIKGQVDGRFLIRIIQYAIQRKQAEMQLTDALVFKEHILTSSPIGILTYKLTGECLSANDYAAGMVGATIEQLEGQNFRELESWRQSGLYELAEKAITSGELSASDIHIFTTFGKEVWFTAQFVTFKSAGQALLLLTLGDITERKQAEEKIRRQLDYLTALRDIDRTIVSTFDMRLSINALISHAVSLLAVDAVEVLLLDSEMATLKYAAGLGFWTDAASTARVKLGESYAGRAALGRRIVQIPNLADEPDNLLLTGILKGENFVSYYGAPLVVKGKVIGVLEVFHRSAVKRDQEWLDFFDTLAGQAAIAIDNAQLFDGLQRSNTELILAYDATIEGWSRAMDLRDRETEGHTQRVAALTLNLARKMQIDETQMHHIRRGALLHDIGKLGVPDSILFKPDKLTDEEWEMMRQHPIHAYEMLSPITYLKSALDIPYCHHEKWDGTGYPRHLKGEQIPLAARIFAVVDVWDALTGVRPYRPAWTQPEALDYIREQSGKQFDPQVVEAFLDLTAGH